MEILENLDSVVDYIIEKNLIEKGDRVGVGVSGGPDSMALLHFLCSIQKSFGFELVVINVNHNIRANSRADSRFVSKYCKDNGIKYVGYNVNVPQYAKQQKIGTEQAAREKRFECFGAACKKFKLNKLALAHHQSDQAETILMHIFRGSGVAGARGMDTIHEMTNVECTIIRPFLETTRTDIITYNYRNQIQSVEDASNSDNSFARNFIRNKVIPLLQTEWRGVEKNIVDFGANCRSDDEYLNSIIEVESLISDENHVRIPLNFFAYQYPIVSRIILSAFSQINSRADIEKKHIDMIMTLASTGENGSKCDLPNNLFAVKEYEYIAIAKKVTPASSKVYSFKIGKTNFVEYGTIIVTKTISHKDALSRGLMVIDTDKLPKASKWRTRKDGDTFTKFGGGTKTLNAYFIDKKIPTRLRDRIPVLAYGNEIYAIADIGISDKVKTDRETIEAYVLEFIKD